MRVAPIACSVTIAAQAGCAFDLFARQTGRWWPEGRRPESGADRQILFEPQVNGRCYEVRGEDRHEQWGKVLVYIPPRTLIIEWRLGADFAAEASSATELEIYFLSNRDGSTRVTIIHAGLERLEIKGEEMRDALSRRWSGILLAYRDYAEKVCPAPRKTSNAGALRERPSRCAGRF